jgi:transposase InsO family protein
VTPAEIIYHRRVRLLSLADELGNVSAACRQMGISRTRYYEWRAIVAAYGLEALMPKERRRPQLPDATPTHVIEDLLTLAVIEPTLGCRQYADRLGERGYRIGKTTVQKLLVDHGLGRRAQRVARAAAITAATTGLSTEAARVEPFGFCHYSPAPGCQVAMDSFYIGNLKGVGKVYQLTAIDVATRWAIMLIVIGPPTASHTIRFVDHVIKTFRRLGVPVRAVLSDNGPEWIAGGFQAHLALKGVAHHRIPPRSPNHNAVCERFQGTALQECWRPAFHRRRFTSIRQLQAEADAWLIRYHHRRRNHSDYMRGRTPAEILDNFQRRQAS